MKHALFQTTSYPLSLLIQEIDQGSLGLPELQRPFVWTNAKVRDLFDSMYNGYPVGTLLLWNTGAGAGSRQIGGNPKDHVPQKCIVDGQQRLTSAYAIMTGTPVTEKNYTKRTIRLGFNARKEQFEVSNAAIEKDPDFIPDITALWKEGYKSTVRSFFQRLTKSRKECLTQQEEDELEDNIDRVRDLLLHYRFQALVLSQSASEEQMAEIFVRINSKGVHLNASDFILTLMSVHWEEGRKELENFSKSAVSMKSVGLSPKNPFIDPTTDQMLRVGIAFGFRRARLRSFYRLLSIKGSDSTAASAERRTEQFEKLQKAQSKALNLTNWHEYLNCLQAAGFQNTRMISGKTAVMYSYAIWLIGKYDFSLDHATLRGVISRWFFMSQTTRRYTGSSETQLENDLRRLSDLPDSEGSTFTRSLDRIVNDKFTSDYWGITLPLELDTSSSISSQLYAYWAALNLLKAEALGGGQQVRDLFNPDSPKSLERHHLFPKRHLKLAGIVKTRQVNTIGNMSFIDSTVKAKIGRQAPAGYWPLIARSMSPGRLKRHCFWHALPSGWEHMDYSKFIERRRHLIAKVIKAGFEELTSPAASVQPSLEDRIQAGESEKLELKSTARWNMRTGKLDKRMEHAVLKTVCGFLNSKGGELVIGVDDSGDVIGLSYDMSTLGKRQNHDGYELFLRNMLDARLSVPTAALVTVRFSEYKGKAVCVLGVSGSNRPVFAQPLQGSKQEIDFWVRNGNSTKRLVGDDMLTYQNQMWS